MLIVKMLNEGFAMASAFFLWVIKMAFEGSERHFFVFFASVWNVFWNFAECFWFYKTARIAKILNEQQL